MCALLFSTSGSSQQYPQSWVTDTRQCCRTLTHKCLKRADSLHEGRVAEDSLPSTKDMQGSGVGGMVHREPQVLSKQSQNKSLGPEGCPSSMNLKDADLQDLLSSGSKSFQFFFLWLRSALDYIGKGS